MEAAIEAFHCALGATLYQVEVEVDKEGVEKRHNFMAVLGVRISKKASQSSKLYFILLGLCLARGCRHRIGTTSFSLNCEVGCHLLRGL